MGFFVFLSHVVKQALWLLAQPANILIHSDSGLIPERISAQLLGLRLAIASCLLGVRFPPLCKGPHHKAKTNWLSRKLALAIVSSFAPHTPYTTKGK
jgi:hypothetical protein